MRVYACSYLEARCKGVTCTRRQTCDSHHGLAQPTRSFMARTRNCRRAQQMGLTNLRGQHCSELAAKVPLAWQRVRNSFTDACESMCASSLKARCKTCVGWLSPAHPTNAGLAHLRVKLRSEREHKRRRNAATQPCVASMHQLERRWRSQRSCELAVVACCCSVKAVTLLHITTRRLNMPAREFGGAASAQSWLLITFIAAAARVWRQQRRDGR